MWRVDHLGQVVKLNSLTFLEGPGRAAYQPIFFVIWGRAFGLGVYDLRLRAPQGLNFRVVGFGPLGLCA